MSFFTDIIVNILLSRLPRSTEDWAAGDLAVCIDTRGFLGDGLDPKEGEFLRVTAVCTNGLFLHFDSKSNDRHWLAVHFRKVKPDAERAADAEWIDRLKQMRPKVDA